ncbi:MAG: hydantoinase/carbamoylase family amidase [Rhizobiales bacterium]|nr:hydantoinase/carbamoylase family amidase [Hyphomicrobiales bacterium]
MASAATDLAHRLFDELLAATADPPGVTRRPFDASEQAAHDIMRRAGEALGATTRVDAIGNLFLDFPGADPKLTPWLFGSHLDSVRHGGNFDGAAGVIAGLALAADLAERGERSRAPFSVVAFRAEEAWFALSYPGSEAALGTMPLEWLEAPRFDTGRTMRDHLRAAGLDPDGVARRERSIDPARCRGFVEVHIEQGPALVANDLPVGLVEGIAGGIRFMQGRVTGTYGHSGATARGYRQDAVLGFCDLATGLETVWDEIEARGQTATITFGKVQSDPEQHGGSKVLGQIDFALDIRSQFPSALEYAHRRLDELAEAIAERRGVSIDFGEPFTWNGAPMDPALIDRLESAARDAGVPVMRMPSGAGHDAAVLALAGIPTAMLFVRNENGSHNPHEAMEIDDLMASVAVLRALVTADE